MKIKLIVAQCRNKGIGKDGHIPWEHPEDLKYFYKMTRGNGNNSIIMGKYTYQSIGRPLPNRENIVLSSTFNNPAVHIQRSLENAIKASRTLDIETAWIIGGEKVYREALEKDLVEEIHVTNIDEEYHCNKFFTDIPEDFKIVERKNLTDLIEVLVYRKEVDK